jgi:hypothetical protein
MDISTLLAIASCLSGVGACASAWATLRAVKEMRKQREASYMPDIGYSTITVATGQRPVVTIRNIGLGVAKNIAVDISVPTLDAILPTLNDIFRQDNIRIFREGGNLIFESRDKDNSDNYSSLSHSIPCVTYVKYLFPGMDNAVKIQIPEYFQELLRHMAEKSFVQKDTGTKKLFNSVEVKSRFAFDDIGGKHYTMEHIHKFFSADYDFENRTYRVLFN